MGKERDGKGEGIERRGEKGEGGREEERWRETKGFISRILLFEPWQLCRYRSKSDADRAAWIALVKSVHALYQEKENLYRTTCIEMWEIRRSYGNRFQVSYGETRMHLFYAKPASDSWHTVAVFLSTRLLLSAPRLNIRMHQRSPLTPGSSLLRSRSAPKKTCTDFYYDRHQIPVRSIHFRLTSC